MDPKVTDYINKAKKWKNEMTLLRRILLDSSLEESIKWGKPCYAFNNTNIIILQAFKEHCDLGFFKGGLLTDVKKKLIKAGEHTQLGRQWRFLNDTEIVKSKTLIKTYIKEAIEIEKKETPSFQNKNQSTSLLLNLNKYLNQIPNLKKHLII